MLTNEEALSLIHQHGDCYVVWATDRNVIVAVHPIPQEATANERISALGQMKTDHSGPTRGRFLSAATTTLAMLKDEQREATRIADRTTLLKRLAIAPLDELLDRLLDGRFEYPLDRFSCPGILLDRIYKIRANEIQTSHLTPLTRFADEPLKFAELASAQEGARCYLSVLLQEPRRLNKVWTDKYATGHRNWFSSPFLEAAGDLPTGNSDIVSALIDVVERRDNMFGARYHAMVILGKIGPLAGSRAVDVLMSSIPDSDAQMTAVRTRAINHIRATEGRWTHCPHCLHGVVDDSSSDFPSILDCPNCLGLAAVPSLLDTASVAVAT